MTSCRLLQQWSDERCLELASEILHNDNNLLNSSVKNGASRSTLSFSTAVEIGSAMHALFVRELANNGDDVIDLKGAEQGEIAVKWRWCVARWWRISGGCTDAGNLVVKITVQIACVDCR